MNNPAITVIIHTLNEEKNIRNCLECLKWADEIIIIDMFSDDKTVEIAQEYTNKIFSYERMRYADPARQFGLQQASNEWVLVVDADELVPIQLRNCLLKIARENQYDAVSIPRRNYFFGYCMQETGWGALEDKQMRFFKQQYMTYTNQIHCFVQLSPLAKVLHISDPECSFIHFNYIDVEHFIEKLNRYTTIEAENKWDKSDKFSKIKVFKRIYREFWHRFVKRKGYKDGFQGIMLAILMSMYRATTEIKYYLMKKYGTNDVSTTIKRQYDMLAQVEINKYVK